MRARACSVTAAGHSSIRIKTATAAAAGAFNNVAYGGVSHPLYGTLTAGRQTSLVSDGMGTYDPIPGSPAFSLLGYSAAAGAGTGSSEFSAWDNSVKYILSYGPFHAAGMYTNGGQDTPMVNDGYGANAGITYLGFSIDGFYTKENGAVNLRERSLGGQRNTWLHGPLHRRPHSRYQL